MGVRASHRHSSVTNACIHGRSFAPPPRMVDMNFRISNYTPYGCNGDIPVPRTGGTAVPARLSRTSSICSGSAHRLHERNPNRTDRHDTCDADGSVGTGVVCGHQCDHSGQWQPDAPDGLQHARIQPPQSTSQSAPRLGLLSSSGWTWPCASRALWSTQHDLPIPGNRP